ncbi:MAG: PLDc N-terminal domain-containing protein [Nitrospirae bacterium]|nr:PLDc N-terminal domain-containing protein [Nitrospirota bacterium]
MFSGTDATIVLVVLGTPIVLWLYSLIDLLKNNFKGGKVIWFLVICFLPLLGPLLYLLIGRKQKIITDTQTGGDSNE